MRYRAFFHAPCLSHYFRTRALSLLRLTPPSVSRHTAVPGRPPRPALHGGPGAGGPVRQHTAQPAAGTCDETLIKHSRAILTCALCLLPPPLPRMRAEVRPVGAGGQNRPAVAHQLRAAQRGRGKVSSRQSEAARLVATSRRPACFSFLQFHIPLYGRPTGCTSLLFSFSCGFYT